MEKTWHNTCFTCWSCGAKFTAETGFHDLKGNPHCEKGTYLYDVYMKSPKRSKGGCVSFIL